MDNKIVFLGLPKEISSVDAALFRSRVCEAFDKLRQSCKSDIPFCIFGAEQSVKALQNKINNKDKQPASTSDESVNFDALAKTPSYTFSQLVLPQNTLDEIKNAIQILKVESLVFDTWGLRTIEPYPKTALNFYGPPGTGKTLAAHAIASFLNKKIMVASYAEIESKYHGDGPKNVKALFAAADKENAVLFIDEADSLLSRRLTNVTQGSEQAINSMRSQLLINLELFHGVVIFSTNLVQNYDKAFETRVHHIQFTLPDETCRKEIWLRHLPSSLPLSEDVNVDKLATEIDDICGRDIKNAIIQSAIEAALHHAGVEMARERDLDRAGGKSFDSPFIEHTDYHIEGIA